MLQNGICESIPTAGHRPMVRGRGRGRLAQPANDSVAIGGVDFNKEPYVAAAIAPAQPPPPAQLLNYQRRENIEEEDIRFCSDSVNTSTKTKSKKPEQQLYVPRPRRVKQQLYQDADIYYQHQQQQQQQHQQQQQQYQQQQQQHQHQQFQYSTEDEDDIWAGHAPSTLSLSSSSNLCNTGHAYYHQQQTPHAHTHPHAQLPPPHHLQSQPHSQPHPYAYSHPHAHSQPHLYSQPHPHSQPRPHSQPHPHVQPHPQTHPPTQPHPLQQQHSQLGRGSGGGSGGSSGSSKISGSTKNGCHLKKSRREVEIYVPRAKRQLQLQNGGGGDLGGGGVAYDALSPPKGSFPLECRQPASPLDRMPRNYEPDSYYNNGNDNYNNYHYVSSSSSNNNNSYTTTASAANYNNATTTTTTTNNNCNNYYYSNNNSSSNNTVNNRSGRCQDTSCDMYSQASRTVHHGSEQSLLPAVGGHSNNRSVTKSKRHEYSCNNTSTSSSSSSSSLSPSAASAAVVPDFGEPDKDLLSPLSSKSQLVAGNPDQDTVSSFHRPTTTTTTINTTTAVAAATSAAAATVPTNQRTRSPEARATVKNNVPRGDNGSSSQETSIPTNHSASMSARKCSKQVSSTPKAVSQKSKTDSSGGGGFSAEYLSDSDLEVKPTSPASSTSSQDNPHPESFPLVKGREGRQSSVETTVENRQLEASTSATRGRTPPKTKHQCTKRLSGDSSNSENNVEAPTTSSTCDKTESGESSGTEPEENSNGSHPERDSRKNKKKSKSRTISPCDSTSSDLPPQTELSSSPPSGSSTTTATCDDASSRTQTSPDRSSPRSSTSSKSKSKSSNGDTTPRTTAAVPELSSSPPIADSQARAAASEKSLSPPATTSSSSIKPAPSVDADSWEALYDDNGDCLESQALEELTASVGKVTIQKNKINYLDFQPKDSDLDYKAYDHVLEVFDFPSELQTRDIICVFANFRERGFDIKWVDDTHALAIFNSPVAAKDALTQNHPLLKVRPMSEASKKSKQKAKRCTEFLQPYKPRPETSAITARRMVTGALGLTPQISKQKRDQERQQLKEAREKKRQDRLTKHCIWDGNIGKCAMDTANN
ncbi:coiled-coil domain-containing protein R3HCC1L-like [Argonauta hians]